MLLFCAKYEIIHKIKGGTGMEIYYVTPNETIKETDSKSINAAIVKAKERGYDKAIIPKLNKRTNEALWVIDETISLPSDIELVIDNANLVMADDTFCNMIANENYLNGKSVNAEDFQKNIYITGVGNAIIDGGKYNGLSEFNHSRDGRPPIRVNTPIMFVNCENVHIDGIKVINQRYWGINNVCVRYSSFRNIEFKADLSRVDENGVLHKGESPLRKESGNIDYNSIYVKNADGIDLRAGCHHILIENITGFTEDDTVALTALQSKKSDYFPEELADSIHDVIIRNVASDCFITSNVRLLTSNGKKMYNILVDGVTDTRETDAYESKATVRINDVHPYGNGQFPVMGDTKNIIIKNVISKSMKGVSLANVVENLVVDSVTMIEDGITNVGVHEESRTVEVKNATFRNLKNFANGNKYFGKPNLIDDDKLSGSYTIE